MELLMDDPETNRQFRQISTQIRQYKNGELVSRMEQSGIHYKTSWGVPVADLRSIADLYSSSHLLALKLWNKQWRETMILASMLDEPLSVTEQQMDYWTKSFENIEIAGQVSSNLWHRTVYAYVKSLEWCRGKKYLIRYTGVHLAGKLALNDKQSPDEIFEPFFGEFIPLARDPGLYSMLYNTMIIFSERSGYLRDIVKDWIEKLKCEESEHSVRLACELETAVFLNTYK